MVSKVMRLGACIFAFVQIGWSANFSVKVDTGVVLLWQSKSGYWAAVKDSVAIGLTDSLYVDEKYAATLKSSQGLALMIRGESRVCVKGNDTAITLFLDQGQVFLKKDETAQPKSVTIAAQGCLFTPVGTAAAVKLTKSGEPSVAVLRGKVRVESPKGQTITVEAGTFGTYSPTAGSFKQGQIPPEAVANLEKWSGTSLEQSAAAGQPASANTAKADNAASQNASSAQSNASAPQISSAQPEQKASTESAPTATAPAANVAKDKEKNAAPEEKKERCADQGGSGKGITWEVSAASVTVDGAQWTRLSVSPDIPIWKFGIGLDVECFLDQNGNFSQKGWWFGDSTWYTSVLRKIKYIRFGYENDPVFAKAGGLGNVTLGYGFIVDRFTNLLRYPDEKLFGVQLYLNNVGPIGLTLQTMTPDVMEFKDKGGIFGSRLAVCPLKPMSVPLLSDLSIGATYAVDLNDFSPARSWPRLNSISDKNGNGVTDGDYAYRNAQNAADSAAIRRMMQLSVIDSVRSNYADSLYRNSTHRYALLGADVGMPIIKTDMLGVDIYGQAGVVADSNMFKSKRTGWGFGAPGARLSMGPLTAKAEYRHVQGKFTPGYFNQYYLNERLQRFPKPLARSQALDSIALDGVFGQVTVNILNFLEIDGSYQYMAGTGEALDQRCEARGSLGEALIKRLPKISRLETYIFKTDINRTIVVYTNKGNPYLQSGKPIYDDFFEQTPNLYWGYRVGFEIAKGASLIWDTRYGYRWSATYRLVADNNMSIGTAITF